MKFDFYSDPGHGWVKVKKSLLKTLGIAEGISFYSYMRGDYAYLEEDCDFAKFVEAMSFRGKDVVLKHHNSNKNSKIRSYEWYSIDSSWKGFKS